MITLKKRLKTRRTSLFNSLKDKKIMKTIRHQLQKDTTHSDNTRMELESVLEKTRMEKGGLSLMEITEIICNVLDEEEAKQVARNILNEVELRNEAHRLASEFH